MGGSKAGGAHPGDAFVLTPNLRRGWEIHLLCPDGIGARPINRSRRRGTKKNQVAGLLRSSSRRLRSSGDPLLLPHNLLLLNQLLLGDIVISVETASRQAERRGHTLLDEIQILMIRCYCRDCMPQLSIGQRIHWTGKAWEGRLERDFRKLYDHKNSNINKAF